jgi:hypothetical protein
MTIIVHAERIKDVFVGLLFITKLTAGGVICEAGIKAETE